MHGLEGVLQPCKGSQGRIKGHFQGIALPGVLQRKGAFQGGFLGLCAKGSETLLGETSVGRLGAPKAILVQGAAQILAEHPGRGAREHSESRKHAPVGGNQGLLHAQGIGEIAKMETARPPEAREDALPWIDPSL